MSKSLPLEERIAHPTTRRWPGAPPGSTEYTDVLSLAGDRARRPLLPITEMLSQPQRKCATRPTATQSRATRPLEKPRDESLGIDGPREPSGPLRRLEHRP